MITTENIAEIKAFVAREENQGLRPRQLQCRVFDYLDAQGILSENFSDHKEHAKDCEAVKNAIWS